MRHLITHIRGVRLDCIALSEAIDASCAAIRTRTSLHIGTVNIGFLSISDRNPVFRDALNRNNVNVIDGRILLWLTRMNGLRSSVQVTGHDLIRELIPVAARNGYRVFLLGAGVNVAHSVARIFRTAHPDLHIESDDGGAFRADGTCINDKTLMVKLAAFRPDLLFVALREPKAELWISRVLPILGPVVAVGVGGVFDTLVGALPRAPRWMQVAGLESAFQLFVAPGRYWKRYLFSEPITLFKALIEVLGTKSVGK